MKQGIEQIEQGKYTVYDENSLMDLLEEINYRQEQPASSRSAFQPHR